MAFIGYYLFRHFNPPPPVTLISTPTKQEKSTREYPSIGSPVRITIPKINVDAVLEYVGLTPEGEMDEPTEAGNAAWLNRRPLPGESGTSVIAGHFGFKYNKPAVFDNLHKLGKGDKVYIKDSKGGVTTFVVQELRNYVPKQDATEVFSSSDGKSHLNLITCKGSWNESLKSYNTRLVVFTDKTENVSTL
jgi:LPXTG-site transpeptidase (sortase) family protein